MVPYPADWGQITVISPCSRWNDEAVRCGARTKSGGACQNTYGSCPHHGSWSAAISSAGGIATRRAGTGGRSATSGPTLQSQDPSLWTADVCALIVLVLALSSSASQRWLPLSDTGWLVLVILSVGAPTIFAIWCFSRCRAVRRTTARRCLQPKEGVFKRCADHHGVTAIDFLGLASGGLAIAMVLVIGRA